MVASFPHLEDPPFRSWDAISKGVSQLWNHLLAHECHFTAPYTHFAAMKWFRNLHALKSFSAYTMNGNVVAAPHFGNCWTHFDHFKKFISCIPYFISNLGKSGVQSFKRCSIWSWNEKVMAVWRRMRKAELEFRSRGAISKGVSQLRNHPLAHECHFTAPYVHFATAKWAAKIPLLY